MENFILLAGLFPFYWQLPLDKGSRECFTVLAKGYMYGYMMFMDT